MTGSPLAVPPLGPRGIPSPVVENSLDGRFKYRDWIQVVDQRGNSVVASGRGIPWELLRNLLCIRVFIADGCKNCCGLTSAEIAVGIAACRITDVAMASDGLQNASGLASAEISVTFATDRYATRPVATTVAFAVNEPWSLP